MAKRGCKVPCLDSYARPWPSSQWATLAASTAPDTPGRASRTNSPPQVVLACTLPSTPACVHGQCSAVPAHSAAHRSRGTHINLPVINAIVIPRLLFAVLVVVLLASGCRGSCVAGLHRGNCFSSLVRQSGLPVLRRAQSRFCGVHHLLYMCMPRGLWFWRIILSCLASEHPTSCDSSDCYPFKARQP